MWAQDPLTEIGLMLGGHRKEDRFWEATLQALAARFDVDAEAETSVVCVDKRRQWGRAGNVRHCSALRSGVHTATAPLRKRG
jgi:hypothetical protein